MRAALIGRDRVNFVDDHGPRRRQHLAPGLGAQQHIERFRRRHQNVRRPAAHTVALGGGRVARAHPGADLDVRQAAAPQFLADAGERKLQIAVDVVGERLERRDIDDLRRVGQPAIQPLADQIVDRGEKRRQRLAGAGGRRDQRVAARFDRRPRLGLGGRRRRKAP